MVAAIVASFCLLGMSLQSVPFGTAYAVWTGIGAAGTVIVGMVAFGEPADAFRLGCLVLIVAGMVGLKLASESLNDGEVHAGTSRCSRVSHKCRPAVRRSSQLPPASIRRRRGQWLSSTQRRAGSTLHAHGRRGGGFLAAASSALVACRLSCAPRDRPASPTASSPATSRSIPAWSGRAPTAPPACWSRSPPPTASATSAAPSSWMPCRRPTSPPRR